MKDLQDCRYSLLDERLLGIETESGERQRVTLPALLARLSANARTELTALQAHQQHAWHAFTVQLAALALVRAGRTTPPMEEAEWRALLVATAQADGVGTEAFTLVVPDLTKPAFLQPPVPEGDLSALSKSHTRPSAGLDVLVTSKNLDVKTDRIPNPTVEHWIFGLVTLQTTQGFLGAGNYGIARMNSGYGSRPCIAYTSGHSSVERFNRDVPALLRARPNQLGRGFAARGGLGMVWCSPWDGRTSLSFKKLDPYFIEICRRVRLTCVDDKFVAYRGPSAVARVDGSAATGNTGDAWTPVSRQQGKALTLSAAGFTYERVQDLIFGEWMLPAACDIAVGGENLWLGQVLVRGDGGTGGYHERWVPVPGKALGFLKAPGARSGLGLRAQQWVKFAKAARLNVLKPAILNLLQGGPEKLKFDDDRAEPFLAHLNSAIDAVFFPRLFAHVDSLPEAADDAFKRELLALAKAELERAIGSVPMSSARRHKAIAFAYRYFWGAARKHLPSSDLKFEAMPPQREGDQP